MKQYFKEFVHNAIVHPLMMFMPRTWGNHMHDVNAQWAFGSNRFDEIGIEEGMKSLVGNNDNTPSTLRAQLAEATVANQAERIRQLEAELGGHLTVGGGHIVYGTSEALARVQAYILLDSKHPIEARDTNRYFAKQLQAAEQHIKQLEVERVPEGMVNLPDEDIIHAMRFYSVTDLISLVRIQSEHVARLQKKLPPMRDEQPRNPRSGGE